MKMWGRNARVVCHENITLLHFTLHFSESSMWRSRSCVLTGNGLRKCAMRYAQSFITRASIQSGSLRKKNISARTERRTVAKTTQKDENTEFCLPYAITENNWPYVQQTQFLWSSSNAICLPHSQSTWPEQITNMFGIFRQCVSIVWLAKSIQIFSAQQTTSFSAFLGIKPSITPSQSEYY